MQKGVGGGSVGEVTFHRIQCRYMFRVLDGPPNMGNTLFGRSRSFDSGGVLLEIGCAGTVMPYMSKYGFDTHTHRTFLRPGQRTGGSAIQDIISGEHTPTTIGIP